MDLRSNAPTAVAGQSEPETRPTAAGPASSRFGAGQAALGPGETRHETREPDSYFIKEHNKGIDEDHLAKFKPDKREWKTDRNA